MVEHVAPDLPIPIRSASILPLGGDDQVLSEIQVCFPLAHDQVAHADRTVEANSGPGEGSSRRVARRTAQRPDPSQSVISALCCRDKTEETKKAPESRARHPGLPHILSTCIRTSQETAPRCQPNGAVHRKTVPKCPLGRTAHK